MHNAQTIVALVPMRHHSVRVPGKNYREINRKPLYHHILETLLKCAEIDQILVDTDSDLILSGVNEHFPSVKTVHRPDHLTADTIPMNEILLYDTSIVTGDFYLQTHSTNPLLQATTISSAIRTFLDHQLEYDSLFSVTRFQTRLWDSLARPVNHNPAILLRTQDLPPLFEENSCLYLFNKEILSRKHNRIGDRPYLFEIGRDEAYDIDEELDFLMVDLMLRNRESENSNEPGGSSIIA
ncbi:MAG: acylneuraminate cytidylyltransferase [Chloroflexi bacterium 44-23]|nr:MAG: acylneuraminate cytidylyltransferase [Chloroflexi bacterium 44-23]